MRQPESAHRKTQTPTVAKQVETERGHKNTCTAHLHGICVFTKFKKGVQRDEKRYSFPIDREIPRSMNIQLVWQAYYTTKKQKNQHNGKNFAIFQKIRTKIRKKRKLKFST